MIAVLSAALMVTRRGNVATTAATATAPVCWRCGALLPVDMSNRVLPPQDAVIHLRNNWFCVLLCCLGGWLPLASAPTISAQTISPQAINAQTISPQAISEPAPGLPTPAMPHDAFVAAIADDASLNDLAFVTEDRLVAVGDCGVILTSENSGRNWEATPTHTTANLQAVCFADNLGVAVGGWLGNATRSSHAVILRSSDGGRAWTPVASQGLPRLMGVQSVGPRLLAWGDYSPRWNSSLFESLDGGQSWHGVPHGLGHASTAGMTADGALGVIDRLGRGFFNTAVDRYPSVARPNNPLRCMVHTGQRWLACGEEGELISSLDGNHWVDVPLPLSPVARKLCRWRDMEQVGDEIWVAGFPGSLLLHSTDRGVTWQLRRTGQTLPLSAVRFVDRNRGWATGPMGLILATRDAGQTWYVQRQTSSRLGVLAIAASQLDCPWSPLVAAAWDDRVSVAAVICDAGEAMDQADFLPSAASVRRDIAPQLGLAHHSSWNQGPSDASTATQRMAAEILCWRPEVVLTSDVHAHPHLPQSIARTALAAIQSAASGGASFATELDLPAWSVSKLAGVSNGPTGQFSEQSRRVLRVPGLSIWDLLLPLPAEDRLASTNTNMQTIWANNQAKSASGSLIGGTAPSADTARSSSLQNIGNYQLVMGRVHRQRSLEQLASIPIEAESLAQWSADLDFIVRTLPPRELEPMLGDLSQQLADPPHLPQQRVVLQSLIAATPHSDAADAARLQLLRLSASDECRAWQKAYQYQQASQLQLAGEDAKPLPVPGSKFADTRLSGVAGSAVGLATWNATPFNDSSSSTAAPVSAVVLASAQETVAPASEVRSHPNATRQAWFELMDQVNRSSPTLLLRPDVELLTFRSHQRFAAEQGQTAPLTAQLENVASAQALIGWPQAAQQELFLAANQIEQLRWIAYAAPADQPPRLDGHFDEACWQAVPSMQLKPLDDSTEAESSVRWAYDDNYLYLALACPLEGDATPPPPVARRSYDSDLSQLDHLQLLLDTDRDYNTAIELAVSADGQTYDRCCGFVNYNPKWHVFVRQDHHEWTAEVAIELSALTTQTDLVGGAWAISARRHQASGYSQSWSQLRTHQPLLQAAGLLLFLPSAQAQKP